LDSDHIDTFGAIREAVGRQGFMRLVGAEVDELARGRAVLSLAKRPEVLQQHGYFHGGAVAFLVDNATTIAAATMVEAGKRGCLAAEYKLNFTSPATGERIVCEAEVLKPGRSLTVVDAKVWSVAGGERKLCAAALATIAIVDVRTPERTPEGTAA
jgi:uncharacterized protein (TIGR00369 family)